MPGAMAVESTLKALVDNRGLEHEAGAKAEEWAK